MCAMNLFVSCVILVFIILLIIVKAVYCMYAVIVS